MSVSLDHPYTCSAINSILDQMEESFKDSKSIPDDEEKNWIEEFTDYFEQCRNLNSDLRDAAEARLSELDDELIDSRDEISTLGDRNYELECELDNLKSEFSDMKDNISEMETENENLQERIEQFIIKNQRSNYE